LPESEGMKNTISVNLDGIFSGRKLAEFEVSVGFSFLFSLFSFLFSLFSFLFSLFSFLFSLFSFLFSLFSFL